MRLCDLFDEERVFRFSALRLSECNIIKPRLISDASKDCFAIMLLIPYPYIKAEKRAFASFARLVDYHMFFDALGKKSAELIADKYGKRYVAAFSDHSPIDERRAAAKCSLGVMGDNGLLITEGYGPFVFIGEIVAELSKEELFEEGVPAADVLFEPGECIHCGRCAAACPAGCIGEGGDKRLCVSALTQKKGVLSDLEKNIIVKSSYVWGCDRCAEVCPYFTIKNGRYPYMFTRDILSPPTWETIEKMSDTEYSKYPFSWRKKEVLKRNFDLYGMSETGD